MLKKVFILLFLMGQTISADAKMQQTTWSPDTCDGCVVVYEWDDAVPQELRIHTAISVKNTDPDFANDTKEIQYQKILEENQRKNIVIGEIIKNNPKLVDAEGILKKDIRIDFSYDKQHVLHLSVSGLNSQEKSDSQNSVNMKVGNGKVILE